MKRIALLLFAGLFGLATLQTSSAQPSDDDAAHDVTIDVSHINNIVVNNDVSFDISGEDIGTDVTDNGTATFDVTTNAPSSRKITVEATDTQTGNANLENVKLQVSSQDDLGGSANTATLTSLDSGLNGPQDLVTGFSNLSRTGISLDYTARVNYDYSPDETTTFTVTYTLTSDGS